MIDIHGEIFSAIACKECLDDTIKNMQEVGFNIARQVVKLYPYSTTLDSKMPNFDVADIHRTDATAIIKIYSILVSEQALDPSKYKEVVEQTKQTELELTDYVLRALNEDVKGSACALIGIPERRAKKPQLETAHAYKKKIERIFNLYKLICTRLNKKRLEQYDLTIANEVYHHLEQVLKPKTR